MRFTSTLITALVATSATAFKVPEDQEDGVYAYKPNGNSAKFRRDEDAGTLIRIGDVTEESLEVVKRGYLPNEATTRCDERNDLNAWDYTGALDKFRGFCRRGDKMPAWKDGKLGILYARVGSGIWYGCSWGGVNPCSVEEINEAANKMDRACGNDAAAWVDIQAWKKGYGRAASGQEICYQHP